MDEILEKLSTATENEQKVFNAGKQEETDAFWEQYQESGIAKSYFYAFSYNRFNDETYNPKYPIRCNNSIMGSRDIFYENNFITDTKVEIYAGTGSLYQAFYNAKKLETIRLLSVYEITEFTTSAFLFCENLKNITFEGVIGSDVWFQYSPLTTKSIVNIVEHLSPTASGMTLTLNTNAVNNMSFPYTSEESGITYNSFDELIGSKSNWTISTLSA